MMEFLERASVLLSLVEALRANGSWTGETHIQKAVYFLENLLDVPLELDFILYKYGPYSFDLSAELAALQANQILELRPQPRPYGPSYVPGSASRLLKASYGKVAAEFAGQIGFVAAKLGPKPVADLEKVATALYVTRENVSANRAARISELKPHVLPSDAERAVLEFEEISREAQNAGLLSDPRIFHAGGTFH